MRGGLKRVSHIENEVYVQFDKDTQGASDRRYLFICDINPNSENIDATVDGSFSPSKTVIVQLPFLSSNRLVIPSPTLAVTGRSSRRES